MSPIPPVKHKQVLDIESTLKKNCQSRHVKAKLTSDLLYESIEDWQQEWLMNQAGSMIHAMRQSQSKQIEGSIETYLPDQNDHIAALKHKLLQASLHMPTKWLRDLVEQKQFETISKLAEVNHYES